MFHHPSKKKIIAMAIVGGVTLAVLVSGLCFYIVTALGENLNDEGAQRFCGYDGCPKIDPNKLNVHLVPHSHDDVGWLKTVDQYFYGTRPEIQRADVQAILDNVIKALRKDPSRKFIYVETAYLWKWWKIQNEETRAEVRKFINEGRLEIISGGWSMNDEATTHYHSIIDQFTWGFRRLNDTFGECARPKIGWQIDAFGHSREQASLLAQFGFDATFFARLDWQDKDKRLLEKTAEFIWKASPNLGDDVDLFSVALYNHYSAPNGFCFDSLCSDTPLVDSSGNPWGGTESKIRYFFDFVKDQARHYQTNNVILTMGDDFQYQKAEQNFRNLDALIRYSNEIYGRDLNVFYSTPSCYTKAVHSAEKTWPTKTDDFFPYSHNTHSFWTGFYTSRPTLKYFERLGNNFLQIIKQLSVLSNQLDSEELQFFREVMGVMQHHDAITGTEKQHVADDYAKFLHDAFVRGQRIVARAMTRLTAGSSFSDDADTQNPTIVSELRVNPRFQNFVDNFGFQGSRDTASFQSCLLLNISACQPTEDSKNFVVTLYNPRSHPASAYVRLPVKGSAYTVKDHTGAELPTQLVPISNQVIEIPGRVSDATRELVFRAVELPPLGFQSFYVAEKTGAADQVTRPADVSRIGGDLYDISVEDNGNVVVQWKNKELRVIQSMRYYLGGTHQRASGAYLFRPINHESIPVQFTGSYKFYKGPIVEELHVKVNEYVSEVVRFYAQEERVEFDWVIGPIDIDSFDPKEIVTVYTSFLDSEKTFYTDSNGREMLKRVRNFRPTWNLSSMADPVSSNYYPITAKISLQDEAKKLRLTVLNDRAQGGGSIQDGELEIMLHRRLLYDDGLGVAEELNEKAFGTGLVARGVHYLVGSDLNDLDATAAKEKSLAQSLALKPWVLVTPVEEGGFEEWKEHHRMQFRGLRKRLPPNVQILTLEPWKENEILLRLEHFYELDEAVELSQPVEINMKDLFTDFDILQVRETTLGANQWIENKNRLKWLSQTDERYELANVTDNMVADESNRIDSIATEDFSVVLRSMEIRTFIVTIGTPSSS